MAWTISLLTDSVMLLVMDAAADTLCCLASSAQGAFVMEPWGSVDNVAAHLGVARDEVDEWARGGGAHEQPAKR